ncbi:MAG: 16S rRNA (cytosine(1402)-N(4))-methyltransferase [Rhodospirillaceae bacterium]|nr:16S rRNA (cytosine(1402)-N(4))-methyltransferase [Alphaproteobacteria bacterium]MBR71508.1 16S rRNA (cytosine(1402)-N(4))-methyltransferase [Rhodospirillaceae bacterium]|tara:strand:- start:7308 stop:8276 length:969 start_codon:yes stop_codon:yes gene_type:complete
MLCNYNASEHIPVMLPEVLTSLALRDGGTYFDGTFGNGGYSRAILKSAKCKTICIDADPDALENGKDLLIEYPEQIKLVNSNFAEMESIAKSIGENFIDGITLDLGVSSAQLKDAKRGFSFMRDGPLDMRMGQTSKTAADIINQASEEELRLIIHKYGEEKQAKRIARAICLKRKNKPISSTLQLANLIKSSIGQPRNSIDSATRTFQALRIVVNDEIEQLRKGLISAERILKSGGRLVVVSFHSLEDREVKKFFNSRSGNEPTQNRHIPDTAIKKPQPSLRLLFKGAQSPSEAEIKNNPRARSARLRAAERTETPLMEKRL